MIQSDFDNLTLYDKAYICWKLGLCTDSIFTTLERKYNNYNFTYHIGGKFDIEIGNEIYEVKAEHIIVFLEAYKSVSKLSTKIEIIPPEPEPEEILEPLKIEKLETDTIQLGSFTYKPAETKEKITSTEQTEQIVKTSYSPVKNGIPYRLWTPLSVDLINKLSVEDAYRVLALSLTCNKENVSTITLEQLADLCGESRRNYYKNNYRKGVIFPEKLKDIPEITIEENPIRKNNPRKYTIKKGRKNIRIHRDFLQIKLPMKVKGFLLKLYFLSKNNVLKCSNRGIAKQFDIARPTVIKYMRALINNNLIKREGDLIIFNISDYTPYTETVEESNKDKGESNHSLQFTL